MKAKQRARPLLRLPHEHDESAEAGARRRSVIVQAEKDVRRGLVDTDDYTRLVQIASRFIARRQLRHG